MFTPNCLQNQIAIVTGGARGIGRAIVTVLAQLGAEVTFFYHQSAEMANEVLAELESQQLKVNALCVDIRDTKQCEAAIEKITNTSDRIDILVNNSGIIRDNLLAGLTEEDVKAVFDTNIVGVFNMTRVVVPHMMRKRSGKIINISSVAGEKGGRGQTNYAASKGAINAFTKSLAVELAPRKINVNSVAPGVIATDMSKEVRELGGEEALTKILLKRFGEPQDIANAVAFLASPYADYITGEILHVDGGFKMA
jgi:3-oxoacyl-[acyl-carrier protein] reductase